MVNGAVSAEKGTISLPVIVIEGAVPMVAIAPVIYA